jgi:Ala-tRNA(Pro) deacylase
MPIKQLKEFLDSSKVKYLSMSHSPAFTSQEIAASAHISGKQLAKTVIVKAGDKLAMVVLPASQQVNFAKLHELMGVQVDLASESEFKDKFPGCEVGAMPPFGNLFNMPVYVSGSLSKYDAIVFNAGSHAELMQMTYQDFERLVQPNILAF